MSRGRQRRQHRERGTWAPKAPSLQKLPPKVLFAQPGKALPMAAIPPSDMCEPDRLLTSFGGGGGIRTPSRGEPLFKNFRLERTALPAPTANGRSVGSIAINLLRWLYPFWLARNNTTSNYHPQYYREIKLSAVT